MIVSKIDIEDVIKVVNAANKDEIITQILLSTLNESNPDLITIDVDRCFKNSLFTCTLSTRVQLDELESGRLICNYISPDRDNCFSSLSTENSELVCYDRELYTNHELLGEQWLTDVFLESALNNFDECVVNQILNNLLVSNHN